MRYARWLRKKKKEVEVDLADLGTVFYKSLGYALPIVSICLCEGRIKVTCRYAGFLAPSFPYELSGGEYEVRDPDGVLVWMGRAFFDHPVWLLAAEGSLEVSIHLAITDGKRATSVIPVPVDAIKSDLLRMLGS